MAFDWKEFLELARILGRDAEGSGHREAFLRSALGRAYYAAFCHARNYARDYPWASVRDTTAMIMEPFAKS
jgi:hypothetical protein